MYCFLTLFFHLLIYTITDAINVNDGVSFRVTTNNFTDGLIPIDSREIQRTSTDSNDYNKRESLELTDSSVPWDQYIHTLVTITTEQLNRIKYNMYNNYNLDRVDRQRVHLIRDKNKDYTDVLHNSLNKLKKNGQFNKTVSFMLEFTDIANTILEKVIELNIDKIKKRQLNSTRWHKHTLEEKILRQEFKIASNRVIGYICDTLRICKHKTKYSDYLKTWLRYLISAPLSLKEFFAAVPEILDKYKKFVKSNLKFKQTIKYILMSKPEVQKDTLDFVDEVLYDEYVVESVADALQTNAQILLRLIRQIDLIYETAKNKIILDSITHLIRDWADEYDVKMTYILEGIMKNMQINFLDWPENDKRKIKHSWSKIIAL